MRASKFMYVFMYVCAYICVSVCTHTYNSCVILSYVEFVLGLLPVDICVDLLVCFFFVYVLLI